MPVDNTEMFARLQSVLAMAREGNEWTDESIDTNAQKAAAELAAKKLEPNLSAVILILSACKTPQAVQDMLTEQHLVVERSRSVDMSHRKQSALFKVHAQNLRRLADLLGAAVCYHAYHAMKVSDGTALDVWKEHEFVSLSNGLRINVTFGEWVDDPIRTYPIPEWQLEPYQVKHATAEEYHEYCEAGRVRSEVQTMLEGHAMKDGPNDLSVDFTAERPYAKGSTSVLLHPLRADLAVEEPDFIDEQSDLAEEEPQSALQTHLNSQQAEVDAEEGRLESGKAASTLLWEEHTKEQDVYWKARAAVLAKLQTAKTPETAPPPKRRTRVSDRMSSGSVDKASPMKDTIVASKLARLGDRPNPSKSHASAPTRSSSASDKKSKPSLIVKLPVAPIELAKLETRFAAKTIGLSYRELLPPTSTTPYKPLYTADVACDKSHNMTRAPATDQPKIILDLRRRKGALNKPDMHDSTTFGPKTHADTVDADAGREKRARSLMDEDPQMEAVVATKKARKLRRREE
ncbi:hypothetical protein LTR10_012272 [Elasticomyces elasticus]|nr:hypothetical protein LTR10_012272 [Elasticomyces elasticus]KAK4965749.1 hypothetical protein LTR42_011762 [Elasticomyces elasticus]